MAGINLSSLVLYDNWPGPVNPNLGIPTDGWDSTRSNFKTTSAADQPAYPLGTKIMHYTDNSWCPGWYTMMYLMYHSYEAGAVYDVSKDFSDGYIFCTKCDGSTAQAYGTIADVSTIPYYVVSKCLTKGAGDVSVQSAVAIPCYTLASDGTGVYVAGYGDSYGWFWVSGVCPAKDVTLMDNAAAGIGSVCAGIGACVSGNFIGKARGTAFLEFSVALGTVMLTCDQTSVTDLTTFFENASMTPVGWICMTAI